jgi:predicted MPP superfamily phosphohydrolase
MDRRRQPIGASGESLPRPFRVRAGPVTPPDPATLQPWVLLVLYGGTLALVWKRSVFYRRFVAVLLGVLGLIWWGLSAQLQPVGGWLFLIFETLVAFNFVRLVNARLRSVAYRALLTIPAQWFMASTVLALPFAVSAAVGHPSDGFIVAYLLGAFGVIQSLTAIPETLDLRLDRRDRGPLKPVPRKALQRPKRDIEHAGRSVRPPDRALRIAQITDPHLGPFMSAEQLAAVCQRVVDREPDLVFITGDLLTMESHDSPDAVANAFSPLKALEGRVFACHGNHDHEDRATVREGLERNGVRLLVDEWARVDTPIGPVDVIGAEYHWKERTKRLHALFEGREDDGTPRILMLHNPNHLKHLPEGETDLILAGHTHGGQVGLLSLGSDWTFVRGFTSIPDHGLWTRGRDRLYVHRGTGHYGFPLRIGVPREESLLRVRFVDRQPPDS